MKISILTPSLNCGRFLPLAGQSILSQAGEFSVQWIVVDGQSQDDTVSYLKSVSDPRLKWISEKDSGLADAVNKGLKMAEGEVVGWLNGDDLYEPDALATAAASFLKFKEAKWVIGRCDIVDDSGGEIRSGITQYKNRLLDHFSYRKLLRVNMISQPAVFFRREFAVEIGPLDASLNWTMDYDWWLRMAARSAPLILPQNLARFRVHGQSKSQGGRRAQFVEEYRVACRYCGADAMSRWIHRINLEKITWGYRAMRLLGK